MMALRDTTGVSPAENRRTIACDRSALLPGVLCFAVVGLFIPSVYVRAATFVALGMLIYVQERRLGLLVPASPGFSFWIANFLCYVVGGMGTAVVYDAWNDWGIRYLDSALLYLELGMASYVVGMLLAGNLVKRGNWKTNAPANTVFKTSAIVLLSGMFVCGTIGMWILQGTGVAEVYYNLVIGTLLSIAGLPPVLLCFYLIQPKRKWWAALLLLGATFIVFLDAITAGGRSQLLFTVLTLLLTWISVKRVYQQTISNTVKVLILLSPILASLFFGVNTFYRIGTQMDPFLSIEERLQIIQDAILQIYQSENPVTRMTGAVVDRPNETFELLFLNTVGPLVDRLVEKESLELIGQSEAGVIERAGWTVGDLQQILFSWVPKVYYPQKGVGYRRDIMEYYGFATAPWVNLPVTVLADVFRRSGAIGVVFLYFFIGLASTAISLRLSRNWGILGVLLAFYFAQLHLNLYSTDALYVFILYVYRLPSSALVIYALLRVLGIVRVNRTKVAEQSS